MTFLAEISDKMPSIPAIIGVCLFAAAIGVAAASAHRGIAWGVLLLASVLGLIFAVGGYREAFVEGPLSDAVWRELGWPWVAASIVAPLVPASAVSLLMVLRWTRPVR